MAWKLWPDNASRKPQRTRVRPRPVIKPDILLSEPPGSDRDDSAATRRANVRRARYKRVRLFHPEQDCNGLDAIGLNNSVTVH